MSKRNLDTEVKKQNKRDKKDNEIYVTDDIMENYFIKELNKIDNNDNHKSDKILLYQNILSRSNKYFKKNNPIIYKTKLSIANMYYDIDRYQSAIEIYETLEKENINDKTVLNKLISLQIDIAHSYFNMNKYTKAKKTYNDILKTYNNLDIKKGVYIENSLYLCYYYLNDYENAEKYMRDLLPRYIKYYGKEDENIQQMKEIIIDCVKQLYK